MQKAGRALVVAARADPQKHALRRSGSFVECLGGGDSRCGEEACAATEALTATVRADSCGMAFGCGACLQSPEKAANKKNCRDTGNREHSS